MLCRLLALAVTAFVTLSPLQAQEHETMSLVLGTATPGGSFPAYGETLVGALHESDPGHLPSAVPTAWLHPATVVYLKGIGATAP